MKSQRVTTFNNNNFLQYGKFLLISFRVVLLSKQTQHDISRAGSRFVNDTIRRLMTSSSSSSSSSSLISFDFFQFLSLLCGRQGFSFLRIDRFVRLIILFLKETLANRGTRPAVSLSLFLYVYLSIWTTQSQSHQSKSR